jgi:hypothetical protein
MNRRLAVRVITVLASLVLIGPAEAAIKPLVVTNLNLPDGNGKFLIFSVTNATAPVLNNAGQVVFWASLQNTSLGTLDDTGIYMYDDGVLKKIVRENDAAPGGANFEILSDVPSLNESGFVAFNSTLRNAVNGFNHLGSYLHNGSELVKIIRRGESIPDGPGEIGSSTNTTVNDVGHLRLKTTLVNTPLGNDFLGLYLHNGSGLVKLVRIGEAVPEGNGQFDDFPSFFQGYNNSDQVAFQATLRNTSGGSNDNTGIYLHNGTSLVNLARAGADAPDGNGQFLNLSATAQLNSAGQVAFRADLRNTAGGFIDNSGIYLHNGSAVVKIARENENVPDGGGKFSGVGFPLINDAGHVLFSAGVSGASSFTDTGIYLHNGNGLVKVVREGVNSPDGNGQFEFFNRLHQNNSGQIAFSVQMRNTSGGTSDDNGFFITDGIETIKIARDGDSLVGAVIAFLDTTGGYDGDAGLRKSFNDFGQLAFRAAAANGSQGLFLYTPDLRWRTTASGSWDTAANWTVSLKPGAPHAVTIDPSTSLTITGPASDVTVSTLTVGNGAFAGQPTLNLQAASVVNSTGAIQLKSDAKLLFELGGTDAGQFARLTTDATAALDGTFDVQFVNGYLPAAGDEFSIVSAAGGISGTFNTWPEWMPVLSGGLSWEINYGANDVVLAVVAEGLFGDYNGNHVIDAADYTVWRDAIAAGATTLLNDFTPGVVDGNDYSYWKTHFGDSLGGGASAGSANVPEPTSLVTLCILTLAILLIEQRGFQDCVNDTSLKSGPS